ncbi:MAG: DnaJ domain-containing protein [Thermodesulfobacteriota bacterium]
MIVYRRYEPPGCGGCLFVAVLILLALGGAPLLFDVLGFLLFSGLFTILLLVVGFWGLTQYLRRQASRYEQSQTESHNQFVFLLVHILVRIAQTDGTVTKAEINTILNFFRIHLRYSQTQLYWVRDLVDEAVRSSVSLDALLAEFRGRFAYEPRLILLELIYQVLYANPQVSPNELAMVQTIADFLEINPYDHLSIRSRYMHGAGARPGGGVASRAADEARYFEILGLQPGATFEQIKSAYRKLSMKYHPDKVGHLGEEFRQVAEEKMKELNQAYQYLKERYG